MQKYSDTVLDTNGNVITGAAVAVTNYPAGTAATVYGSNTPGANVSPLTTDANGYFEFWAPNGKYTLTVSKNGITTRTVTNVLIQDVAVSVTEYGAKGDGVTNDLAAIQSAIDALFTAGGGTVYFPPGTFLVTCTTKGIQYRNNVSLVGAGRGATIIKMASGSTLTSSHGVIEPDGYTASPPAIGYFSKNNLIAHLSVDGNKAGNVGVYECITAAAVKDCTIFNCETYGATEAGIHAQRHAVGTDLKSHILVIGCNSHDNTIDGYQFQGAVIESCYAHDNSIGFHSAANYSGGGDLTNIVSRVSNCEATSNTSAGIVHDLQVGASISILIENTISHNNVGYGISISGINDVAITNCSAQLNTLHGLYIGGDRVTVTGGQYSNNTKAGVYIDTTRVRVKVRGIVATGNAYGIELASPNTGSDNDISGNALTGNVSGAVGDGTGASAVLAASGYRMTDNAGLNPVGGFGNFGNPANPAVPATGVALANSYGYPCLVTISGGTVSGISINGVATNLTSGAFFVSPDMGRTGAGRISVAYTVLPTWQWFGL